MNRHESCVFGSIQQRAGCLRLCSGKSETYRRSYGLQRRICASLRFESRHRRSGAQRLTVGARADVSAPRGTVDGCILIAV